MNESFLLSFEEFGRLPLSELFQMEGNVQPAPQSLSNFTLVEWDGGGGAESSEFLMQTGAVAAAAFGSGDVSMNGDRGPKKMLASAKKKTAKNAEKKAKAKPPAARRRKRKTIQGRPRQDNTPHPDALDSMSSLAANVISREVGGNSAPGGTSSASAYVGVSWHKTNRRWQAQLSMGKKKFHLGCFKNEHAAARAYDAGIVKVRSRTSPTPHVLPRPTRTHNINIWYEGQNSHRVHTFLHTRNGRL